MKRRKCWWLGLAVVVAFIPGASYSLSFEQIDILGTLLHWNKYRTKEQAAAIDASFNKDKRYIREGDKNIKIAFDASKNYGGAVGFSIKTVKADQAISFWVYGTSCNTRMRIRFFSDADSFWESPLYSLDYQGWKSYSLSPLNTRFRGKNEDWSKLQYVQIHIQGNSCVIFTDELRFIPLNGVP